MGSYREIDFIRAKDFMNEFYNGSHKTYGEIVLNFQRLCRYELENKMLESSQVNYSKFLDVVFEQYVSEFEAGSLFLGDWELGRVDKSKMLVK